MPALRGEKHDISLKTCSKRGSSPHHTNIGSTSRVCWARFNQGATALCMSHYYVYCNSVKLSDVTRWKQGYIRTLPHLHCISQLGEKKEVEVIEFHRIRNFCLQGGYTMWRITQQIQNICITFAQRWFNIVQIMLYKCFAFVKVLTRYAVIPGSLYVERGQIRAGSVRRTLGEQVICDLRSQEAIPLLGAAGEGTSQEHVHAVWILKKYSRPEKHLQNNQVKTLDCHWRWC